jgi:hypothetical protein
VYKIAKDDRSDVEESEIEDLDKTKEATVNLLKEQVEALPLLNGNGFANGHANGVLKASGNETAIQSKRRKGAQ